MLTALHENAALHVDAAAQSRSQTGAPPRVTDSVVNIRPQRYYRVRSQ